MCQQVILFDFCSLIHYFPVRMNQLNTNCRRVFREKLSTCCHTSCSEGATPINKKVLPSAGRAQTEAPLQTLRGEAKRLFWFSCRKNSPGLYCGFMKRYFDGDFFGKSSHVSVSAPVLPPRSFLPHVSDCSHLPTVGSVGSCLVTLGQQEGSRIRF